MVIDTKRPEKMPNSLQSSAVAVDISNVSKVYKSPRSGDSVQALRDCSLMVPAGEITVLVGPSGCGKSTLLSLIAGLDSPTKGEIQVDGVAVQGPSWHRGVVFQELALFPWQTVKSNVTFGLRARHIDRTRREQVAATYINLVGLQGFEHRYPHELSGGMRQRAALARSLANEPEILLMDEPFGSVDEQTRLLLQDELLKILRKRKQVRGTTMTVLFITHSIEESVYLGDTIAIMTARPGRILEIVRNPLEKPRSQDIRARSDFIELKERIWALLRREAGKRSEDKPGD